MLEMMRKKGVNKTILWFITVVIILSFGFFGTAYLVDNGVNSAGTMYGHSVSLKDFQKAYADTRDQAILLYGDEFFKLGDRLNLEQETWDRLLLLQEARKRHIQVNDQDVVNFIASIPFFQTNGQFDHQKYNAIVQNPGGFDQPVAEFEQGIREQLVIRKLLDNIAPAEKLTDAALEKIYDQRNAKIILSYVMFKAENYAKDAQANDEEIQKFYEGRKEQFRQPPTITLNYVQSKQKADIDTLSKEVAGGQDFDAAAKKLKLEVKTSQPFTQDQPILTFASNPENLTKLFAMKTGEFSQPMQVPDGWQLIQIKDKKEAYVPPFQEIKDKVKQALLLQKGFEIAKRKADQTLKSLTPELKSKDFKAAAKSLGLSVEQTPAFSRTEFIANVGLIREFQQEAAQLTMTHRLSEVVATTQGPAILYLDSTQAPEAGQFEADKANFREMLAAQSRNQAIITLLTELRLKANIQSKVKQQT